MKLSKTKAALWEPSVWGGLAIIIATLIAYGPALNGGFIWDDDAYVTDNPLLTAPDGWMRIWFSAHQQSQYFPLVYSTLRIEHALWGLNPLGYHLVNVLLHGVNALLAWVVLRRLAIPGAWLAAAIFALHPVQVESVAWITELKNTESTCFYLLAVLAWMRFTREDSVRPGRFYALALLLHALALLAKTTACTLPAALLLVLWVQGKPIGRRRWLQVLPFVAMGLAMGLLSIWWERHLGNYQEKFRLSFTFAESVLIASRALWFYAGKLVWPADLSFSYAKWEIHPSEPMQYLWLAGGVAMAAVLAWRWRQVGRGPIAAVVFFVAALSPLIGFIPLYTFYFSFVADHYQYLACLALFALGAALLTRLAARWQLTAQVQAIGALLLLLVLGLLTWQQAGVYRDAETLWRDTLKKNPRSWLAHTNLGKLLAAQGKRDEAEKHYREALRIEANHGDIHFNLANLLVVTGRGDEAITHYRRALEFTPRDPDPHNNLGVALFGQGQIDKAVQHFRAALESAPTRADIHFNLANALAAQQKLEEAIRQYHEAVRLQPDFAPAKARLRALGVPFDKPTTTR